MNEEWECVAIVGLSGRFPGAADPEALWRKVLAGEECIQHFSDAELTAAGVSPETLADSHYVKARPLLDDLATFDAAFFGMTQREAEITDPQLRLLIECAYEALEQAGCAKERETLGVGVYAGARLSRYLEEHLRWNHDVVRSVGEDTLLMTNRKDSAATLISYRLNLTGPSLSVNTACSTGLVATHLACSALLNHECDVALAGAAAIPAFGPEGYRHTPGGILSPDGHCRAFDQEARGTLDGAGVGVVAMMRLSDALARGAPVQALLLGSALNNDGNRKIGYSAPSVEGQAKVIAEALAVANVPAESIGYIETHGTGTPLGDPIEVEALTRAFRSETDGIAFCGLASLKSNLGHLGAAAGIASLIRAVQALRHGTRPPTLHVQTPNPALALDSSPFFLLREASRWPEMAHPPRVGVSSFGIGGTNAHVVLEAAPKQSISSGHRRKHLLPFSATTTASTQTYARRLAEAFTIDSTTTPNCIDAAFTLQERRSHWRTRGYVVAQDADEAAKKFIALGSSTYTEAPAEQAPVIFHFTGQGTQRLAMGRELSAWEPKIAAAFDECVKVLAVEHGIDLHQLLASGKDSVSGLTLDSTAGAQPALFALEWALAQGWLSIGVQPSALVGHSLGELCAAAIAEVMTLSDALSIVVARGKAMDRAAPGAMLALPMAPEAVEACLARFDHAARECVLSAFNGPSNTVVSGSLNAIAALKRSLDAETLPYVTLRTSHGFHSPSMETVSEEFRKAFAGITLRAPAIPIFSTATGRRLTPSEACDPEYWIAQLRAPVRYQQALTAALPAANAVLIEIGPTRTLTQLARSFVEPRHATLASLDGLLGAEDEAWLNAVGKAWSHGVDIDWQAFGAAQKAKTICLPNMPFSRRRAWIDASPRVVFGEAATSSAPASPLPPSSSEPAMNSPRPTPSTDDPIATQLAQIWRDALGEQTIAASDSFFDLGGNSLLALQVIGRVNHTFGISIGPTDLLTQPTFAELTQLVTTQMLGKTESSEVDAIMAELSLMSDEDAQKLLDAL